MKRFFSVMLAFVVALTSLSVVSSAEMIGENGILGVILDENGNIVEYVPMPKTRTPYVQAGITLDPGEKFNSFQYKPTIGFSAEIDFVGVDGTLTTEDRYICITILKANSVGGQRGIDEQKTFSTTKEKNT